MAQLVEHILGKDEVPGSNPGISLKTSPIVRKYDRGFSFAVNVCTNGKWPELHTEPEKTAVFFLQPLALFANVWYNIPDMETKNNRCLRMDHDHE